MDLARKGPRIIFMGHFLDRDNLSFKEDLQPTISDLYDIENAC
jgi:hypothetical protein